MCLCFVEPSLIFPGKGRKWQRKRELKIGGVCVEENRAVHHGFTQPPFLSERSHKIQPHFKTRVRSKTEGPPERGSREAPGLRSGPKHGFSVGANWSWGHTHDLAPGGSFGSQAHACHHGSSMHSYPPHVWHLQRVATGRDCAHLGFFGVGGNDQKGCHPGWGVGGYVRQSWAGGLLGSMGAVVQTLCKGLNSINAHIRCASLI